MASIRPLPLATNPRFPLDPAVPTVRLKYQSFHPSIWPKMIDHASPDAQPGDFVRVIGREGTPFGWGFWNPRARMPLRVVSHDTGELDETFFERAIESAAALRHQLLRLPESTECFRAIHGDADFLPGLVADKFGDVLSIEVTTLAAWQRLGIWTPLLHSAFGTSRQVIRIDPELARIEGIPAVGGMRSDDVSHVRVRENGIRYEVDFAAGHKTGFFCDQRENRLRFGKLAHGLNVLDLCCYTGGFSISAALGGAADVTAVDLDETAIAQARRNANLNQIGSTKIKFTHADAFTWARTMIANERQWDLVIADPPKLIHGRDDETGFAKYHDLNKLALQLVKPGGTFVTCSCSGQLPAEDFEELVVKVAHRRNNRLQTFLRSGAGPDHPTRSNYPESRYLKLLWSRVF